MTLGGAERRVKVGVSVKGAFVEVAGLTRQL